MRINNLRLLKTMAVVMTTTAFSSFILEEAVQTAGFGLFILKDQPDLLAWYIPKVRSLDESVRVAYWLMLPFNPLTQWVYIVFIEADLMKLSAYERMVSNG